MSNPLSGKEGLSRQFRQEFFVRHLGDFSRDGRVDAEKLKFGGDFLFVLTDPNGALSDLAGIGGGGEAGALVAQTLLQGG